MLPGIRHEGLWLLWSFTWWSVHDALYILAPGLEICAFLFVNHPAAFHWWGSALWYEDFLTVRWWLTLRAIEPSIGHSKDGWRRSIWGPFFYHPKQYVDHWSCSSHVLFSSNRNEYLWDTRVQDPFNPVGVCRYVTYFVFCPGSTD